MAHVLIVDDEPDLAQLIDFNLRDSGFSTQLAGTGEAALVAAREKPPELVLLDLMLPDMSGIDVCRQLRAQSPSREVLIVMLTAKGEEADRIRGFEVGADDYVVKPFAIDELTARIEAVLRRSAGHVVAPVVEVGPLRIDLSRRVVEVSGREVSLRRKEFDLLAALARRDGAVVSRADLLDDVWGLAPDDPGLEAGLHSLEVHVAALRSKLDAPGAVVTVRGVGYRLAAGER